MTARRRHNHTNTHTHTYKASTSVFGDRRYSHMPIVCVATLTIMIAIPTLNFTSWWMANSSDFGLLGEQSSPKWRLPAQDAHEPPPFKILHC